MSAKPPLRSVPLPGFGHGHAAAPPVKRGSLRWVRDVLSRSLRLQQGRKPAPAADAGSAPDAMRDASLSLLMRQRAERGARLLVHDPTTQVVGHMFLVHDELQTNGWPGVDALPANALERALAEAEILQADEPSTLLATIIDRLREAKGAVVARALEQALEREFETMKGPEVSDTNFDEFELMERSWAGTVPNGLELPSRTS
jgi:hypothetical protein